MLLAADRPSVSPSSHSTGSLIIVADFAICSSEYRRFRCEQRPRPSWRPWSHHVSAPSARPSGFILATNSADIAPTGVSEWKSLAAGGRN